MSLNDSLFGEAAGHLEGVHDNLTRQTQLLEKAISEAEIEVEAEQYHWLKGQSVTDANGNAQIVLLNQMGAVLELVSYFVACSPAAGNGGVVFLHGAATSQESGQFEPQNGFWADSVTNATSDKWHRGMTVPLQGTVVAQFLNCGVGANVFANLYTRLVLKRRNKPYQSLPPGY